MAGLPFRQLDVFTDRALSGNALAVFPAPGGLSDRQMQVLARETNLSETTFITGYDSERQRYRVRIFTPLREVPFAGHPTIGTAWYLFQHDARAVDRLTLQLGAGDVVVRIDRQSGADLVYFSPPPVALESEYADTAGLAELYGLDAADFELNRSPAQFVSAGPGMRFLIAPVVSRAALERAAASSAALARLEGTHGCALLTVFCPEGYAAGSEFATRMFAPLHGVPEDPATGSSACALAAYLRARGLIDDCGEHWLRLDQGYSIARPSLILLRANAQPGGGIEVQIGGHVVLVAEGQYLVSTAD